MFEILSKKFEIYEITPSQSRFFLQIARYYRVGTVWTVWRKTTKISQKKKGTNPVIIRGLIDFRFLKSRIIIEYFFDCLGG